MSFLSNFLKSRTTISTISQINNEILNPLDNISYLTKFVCCDLIAKTVANVPIILTKKDEKGFPIDLVEDPRYYTLRFRPNDYITRYNFWYTMEFVADWSGNSYAIIHRTNNQTTLEYVPNNKLLESPRIYKNDGILRYKILNPSIEYDQFKTYSDSDYTLYNSSDIIHFARKSKDGINGSNPDAIIGEYMSIAGLASKNIETSFTKFGHTPEYIISEWEPGDIKKYMEALNRFRKETGGSYYEGDKLINGSEDNKVSFPLAPGHTTIHKSETSTPGKEMFDTIQTCDLKTANYYGIPAHALNILTAQKDSDTEMMQKEFSVTTISHILEQNAQELELKLLYPREVLDGYDIRYDIDSTIELDTETRLKKAESLSKTALLSPNEVRKDFRLPWMEGGDAPPDRRVVVTQ